MSGLTPLLDEYGRLCDSKENQRRLALWETTDGLRGETQWHGVPSYTTEAGRPMPVTAECLEKMWEPILGIDLLRSSGMSLLLGGEPDLVRLARWVELVREVQTERG